MMQDPTFSICIPNYNYEQYIGETIQSVLDQTYPHFEIIVADNASTDDSVKVVESFKDPRIRLVRNRYNIGFAPNLQRATMYAQSQYVNLLSSDDKMKPDALATYADVIKAQGERAQQTVLMADTETIDGAGNVVGLYQQEAYFQAAKQGRSMMQELSPKPGYSLHRGQEVLAHTLKQLRTFAPFLTIVYPRVLWEAVEGYNGIRTIGPDKHFNYKLLALDPDVAYVHRPLFQYRVHGSPNYKAQRQTLKQQIDDYLYTIEYPEALLQTLGLEKGDLIREFLDRVCLKTGLTQLVYGTYSHAFRMLAFSLAAYPGPALKRPRFYALAGLLLLGPLGRWVAKPFYHLYRGRREAGTQVMQG